MDSLALRVGGVVGMRWEGNSIGCPSREHDDRGTSMLINCNIVVSAFIEQPSDRLFLVQFAGLTCRRPTLARCVRTYARLLLLPSFRAAMGPGALGGEAFDDTDVLVSASI